MNPERIIEDIKTSGIRAIGRGELIKHLKGERLTQRDMIVAMCYSCMGYYADGRRDCEMYLCPLYRHMPYKGMVPTDPTENLSASQDNERYSGIGEVEKIPQRVRGKGLFAFGGEVE